MDEQANIEKLIGAIDDLWTSGEHEEAIAAADRLSGAFPNSAEAFEKLALLRIHYAADNPPTDQLAPALDALNRALEINPASSSAREVRGHLFFLLAHHLVDATFFQRALKDFLELERLAGPEVPQFTLTRWKLEAARAAFLAARNSPEESADFALPAELFSRVDPEVLESGDWFFRGLSLRQVAERNNDQDAWRLAAQSFLRAVEEDGFETEGRYFAADSLLSLDAPSGEEIDHAGRLIAELEALPRQDFLMDALKQRLELRRKLTQDGE